MHAVVLSVLNHLLKAFVWMCSALWLAAIKPAPQIGFSVLMYDYMLAYYWLLYAQKLQLKRSLCSYSTIKSQCSCVWDWMEYFRVFLECALLWLCVGELNNFVKGYFNGRAGSCAAAQNNSALKHIYTTPELNYAVGKLSCALDDDLP